MNHHPDRPPGLSPHTELVPAAAAYELDVAGADLPAAGKKITLGLVARAVRRHWWQAALVWVVGSVGLMAMIYFKVKPTYQAFSRVRVEPNSRALFGGGDGGNFGEYRETQVNIISQPTVLEAALSAHPELLTFRRLAETDDPIAEIRSTLVVGVVKGTNLIEVATSTESPLESAAIINAVVDAYVKGAQDINSEETDLKIKQLEEARARRMRRFARSGTRSRLSMTRPETSTSKRPRTAARSRSRNTASSTTSCCGCRSTSSRPRRSSPSSRPSSRPAGRWTWSGRSPRPT